MKTLLNKVKTAVVESFNVVYKKHKNVVIVSLMLLLFLVLTIMLVTGSSEIGLNE